MTGITAFVQLHEGTESVEVATLYSQVRRRTVTLSLRYADDYVAASGAYPLEPALPLDLGAQPLDALLPRSWADAAPTSRVAP